MLGHRIGGKRLGIIGMGRIGTSRAGRRPAPSPADPLPQPPPGGTPIIAEDWGATYWESLGTRCWRGEHHLGELSRTRRRPFTCCPHAG